MSCSFSPKDSSFRKPAPQSLTLCWTGAKAKNRYSAFFPSSGVIATRRTLNSRPGITINLRPTRRGQRGLLSINSNPPCDRVTQVAAVRRSHHNGALLAWAELVPYFRESLWRIRSMIMGRGYRKPRVPEGCNRPRRLHQSAPCPWPAWRS
jgi:hypothetical protein